MVGVAGFEPAASSSRSNPGVMITAARLAPVSLDCPRECANADIVAGRLAPDTRLPSEPELSQQYGVARMTVRRAVAQLRDKGLVVTIHGRGSWVAPDDELDAPRTAPRRQPDVPLFDDSA
jgi:DNA-binding transcriptional MocR family regulator